MSEKNEKLPRPIKLIPVLIPKPCNSHDSLDATTTAVIKLIPILRPMAIQNDAQVYSPQEPFASSTNAGEAQVHLSQEPPTNVNQNEAQGHLPPEPTINVVQKEAQGFFPPEPLNSSTASLLAKTNEKKLKPANVYIFNHVKFVDPDKERVGSAKDVEELTKTFEKFKCNVQVITDATKDEVESTIKELKDENFEEHSALVIVVLSHGSHNDIILAGDKTYSLQVDIILPILNNRTLSKKPKLIFVQACKGGLVGFQPDSTSHPNPNDVYIFYSTFEGYLSWRHPENGSLFIQALCKALQEDGDTEDIDVISKRVIVKVAKDSKQEQIPSVRTTLSKEYIFGKYVEN